MTSIQPVILSGGSGTRLWPASRSLFPKQLLPLLGDCSLLQLTALRVLGATQCTPEVLVICNEAHRFLVAEQLRQFNIPSRIILEPCGRSTAPAAALAAHHVLAAASDDEAPLLLVLPADHAIQDDTAFLKSLEKGYKAADDGRLVTFGVVPTYAHTGYGYIESEERSLVASPIKSFVEKPDKKTAVSLLETNRFFWNSGIFLFRPDIYLEQLMLFEPEIAECCRLSMRAGTVETEFIRPDAQVFSRCAAKSIDYAVMEHTEIADVVPMEAGWSDVGSWSALHELSEKDADENVLLGDVVAFDCNDSLIRSSSRLVAAVGLENIVVIEDRDAVLVMRKDLSQNVKKIVDRLKEDKRTESEVHRRVYRPWGSYEGIESDAGFQVKRLIVNPGAVLSLQSHKHRAEHWVVVQGTATITLDGREFDLGTNDSTFVPVGAVHRIANRSETPVHIIEVQCGSYLGEDDIVRYEDKYGRAGTNS